MKKPLLVALCGNDGAGKSTLQSALIPGLQSLHLSVSVVDKWDIMKPQLHPQCGFIKPELDALRVNISQMTGISRALFLFWSMQVVMPDLAHCTSDVVLLDGYWMKHAAAELAMGCPEELIKAVTDQFPIADVTLFLDVDIDTALQRKRGNFTPYECGCDQAMLEQSFIQHQNRVAVVLKEWAASQGWYALNATLPQETLVQQALNKIKREFQGYEPRVA